MNIDPDLLEKVKKDNAEFYKLYEEHTVLKSRVDKFNKTKLITPEQEIENSISNSKNISCDKDDKGGLTNIQSPMHSSA